MAGSNTQRNYFSHDSNARNSERLIRLRMRHGAAGYGVYFMIIERLREEEDYMSVKDYNVIAFDLRVDASMVKSVVEEFGLFVFTDDGKYFYSESLSKRMLIMDTQKKRKSEGGKKAMRNRWSEEINNADNQDIDNIVITKLQDSCNNKKKRNKKKINKKKINITPHTPQGGDGDGGGGWRETLIESFFSKEIALESFCKNNRTDPEDLRRLIQEIFDEWELANETDISERHLVNAIRVKIKLKHEIDQRQQEHNAPGNRRDMRCKLPPEPGYGLIED